jgi:hypothetical protein
MLQGNCQCHIFIKHIISVLTGRLNLISARWSTVICIQYFLLLLSLLTSSPFSMLVSVQGGYVSVYSPGLNLKRRGHTDLMK